MNARISYIVVFLALLCFGVADTANAKKHYSLQFVKNFRSNHIFSPKSAIFFPDGSKFYINSLEGKETLVYDTASLQLKKVIPHTFRQSDAGLFFQGENSLFDYKYHNCFGSGDRNIFSGKPVECVFTHGGRFLWVSYYRRECDPNASSPSALAIIDTQTDTIVRVMPTAPLPKMLAASPNGKYLAVTNWGDNTIGIINIEGNDPFSFSYERLLVVGKKLNVSGISGNRDKECGLCLRGTIFTHDGQYLLVAGMRSNILHVYEAESGKKFGSVRLPIVNPRHFVLHPDGSKLYVSYNIPGKVGEYAIQDILDRAPKNGAIFGRTMSLGTGTRTIAISKDGNHLYAVCNTTSSLSCIDVPNWKVLDTKPVAPYGVGLAVNNDETYVLVTSQGKNGKGGNNVALFTVNQE